MIDLRNLTHLGSDYDRKRDVYLDPRTRRLYVRTVRLQRVDGSTRVVSSTLHQLEENYAEVHRDAGNTYNQEGKRVRGTVRTDDLAA